MINISKSDIVSTNFIDEFYSLEEKKKDTAVTENTPVEYKLTVVVDGSISETEKEFLYKIASSVGLSIEDIQLLTENNDEYLSERIIFFGNTSFLCNKFSLDTYLVDEKNILICDSLKEIEGNTDLKRKLWESLKKIFSIN